MSADCTATLIITIIICAIVISYFIGWKMIYKGDYRKYNLLLQDMPVHTAAEEEENENLI